MKETPIIMQGWGVRAVLADLKTQTRRVVWPQPAGIPRWRCGLNSLDGKHGGLWESTDKVFGCPYGVPGDRLWVRETWRTWDAACGKTYRSPLVRWAADGAWSCGCEPLSRQPAGPWRPSIHMPRWASRITLELTGVRVERVQDISLADVNAEGVSQSRTQFIDRVNARGHFSLLWDTINAKPKPRYARDDHGKKVITHYVSYPWEDTNEVREHRGNPWFLRGNPWLWCLAFERIKLTEKTKGDREHANASAGR